MKKSETAVDTTCRAFQKVIPYPEISTNGINSH